LTRDTQAFANPSPEARAARAGWSGGDLVTGCALAVLVISLFLPWFSASVQLGATVAASGSADGPTSHGYLWLVFVLALFGLALIVARDAIDRLRVNLPSSQQMLIGTTIVAFILCLLGVISRPISTSLGLERMSVGWSYGGFVALAAAAVALVAAARPSGPVDSARRAARAARAVRRRPDSAG
jgi:uncharacterized membrane protein